MGLKRKCLNCIPDKLYLKLLYCRRMKRCLDLKQPQTFNEKLQWLKLYDRKPEYTTMVDKYEVKKYVADLIGEEYIIPTLGIWESFDDIDFDKLPNQFVLKCTHDSGGVIICRDKRHLDINDAKMKISNCLKHNYYWYRREWPYKNVIPRIIVEELMIDSNANENKNLNVYKIMTFSGEPKIIQTIQNDKTPQETVDYFDCNWNSLEIKQNFPNSEIPLPAPKSLQKMIELARKASKGFYFLRVDFYEIDGNPYFSEFTFYSDAGFAAFVPNEWDYILGDWIKLPFELN